MIHLYQYTQLIPVFRNSGNEGLQNTDMFNDHLVLHRNLKNSLKFKLTDRDRRSIDLDNEKIKIEIIDEQSTLIVDTFYLYPTEKAKIFAVELDAEFINKLLPRNEYSFIASIEAGDGSVEPLYLDHEFMMKGTMEVVDNYSQTIESSVSGFTQRIDSQDRKVPHEHHLEEYIKVDDDFIGMEFRTYDNSTRTNIEIQKHNGKYFPIDVNDDTQWKTHSKVYDTTQHYFGKDQLSKDYYRVIVTDNDLPDNHFIVLTHIERL